MAIDLGDSVPLQIQIRDSNGALANATTVTLTITQPDGAVIGTTVTPTTTGVYDYNFIPTQVGRHTIRWVSVGANATAYSDAFDVAPADMGSIISLADAKAQLRVEQSTNDEALRGFLAAATDLIEAEVGAVVPRTVVEVMGCLNSIVLKQSPVVSVTSMVTQQGADLLPYFNLDGPAGMLQLVPTTIGYPFAFRPYNFPGQPLDRLYYYGLLPFYQGQPVTITYKAGRPVVPAAIQSAAWITVQHLWDSRRLSGPKPAAGEGDEQAPGGFGYALPPQAVEMLASMPKAPVVG